MSSVHQWSLAVAAALTFAAPLSAQFKPSTDGGQAANISATSETVPVLSLVPTYGRDDLFVESPKPAFVAPALPGQTRESAAVALMIVGGAALVVGSVIGGDAGTLMMVGGGVIGLVGLYRYVQ
jgi:hypothetical protein